MSKQSNEELNSICEWVSEQAGSPAAADTVKALGVASWPDLEFLAETDFANVVSVLQARKLIAAIRKRIQNEDSPIATSCSNSKSFREQARAAGLLIIEARSIEVGRALGAGSFGVVRKGRYEHKDVALKFVINSESTNYDTKGAIDASGDPEAQEMLREAACLVGLGAHPHVVSVYGMYLGPMGAGLVMEFLAEGSFNDFIRTPRATLDVRLRVLCEAAQGLDHLHSCGLVHRDIACRNILLHADLSARIADFGFARKLDQNASSAQTASKIMPFPWDAPESLFKQRYSKRSDVYMFGACMWETMFQGVRPWPELSIGEVAQRHQAGISLMDIVPSDLLADAPLPVWDLIRTACSPNPEDRPTMCVIATRLAEIRGFLNHSVASKCFNGLQLKTIQQRLANTAASAVHDKPQRAARPTEAHPSYTSGFAIPNVPDSYSSWSSISPLLPQPQPVYDESHAWLQDGGQLPTAESSPAQQSDGEASGVDSDSVQGLATVSPRHSFLRVNTAAVGGAVWPPAAQPPSVVSPWTMKPGDIECDGLHSAWSRLTDVVSIDLRAGHIAAPDASPRLSRAESSTTTSSRASPTHLMAESPHAEHATPAFHDLMDHRALFPNLTSMTLRGTTSAEVNHEVFLGFLAGFRPRTGVKPPLSLARKIQQRVEEIVQATNASNTPRTMASLSETLPVCRLASLDVSRCNWFDGSCLMALACVAGDCLTELKLSHCGLLDAQHAIMGTVGAADEFAPIARLLKSFPQLSSLKLSGLRRSVSDSVLASISQNMPRLQSISVHGCEHVHGVPAAVLIAASAAQVEGTVPRLRLNFAHCGSWHRRPAQYGGPAAEQLRHVASVLESSRRMLQTTDLDITAHPLVSLQDVAICAPHCITRLKLAGHPDAGLVIGSMARGQALERLLTLELSNVHPVPIPAVERMLDNCPNLQVLSMFGWIVSDRLMTRIASACQRLHVLDVRGVGHTARVSRTRSISASPAPSQVPVDVNDASVKALVQGCPELRDLRLARVNPTRGLTSAVIASALLHCRQLERLDLQGCQSIGVGLDALRLENLPLTIDQMLGGDTLPLQLLDLTYVPAATHTRLQGWLSLSPSLVVLADDGLQVGWGGSDAAGSEGVGGGGAVRARLEPMPIKEERTVSLAKAVPHGGILACLGLHRFEYPWPGGGRALSEVVHLPRAYDQRRHTHPMPDLSTKSSPADHYHQCTPS